MEEIILYRVESSLSGYLRGVKFKVVKETPKGYWIDEFGFKRWISKTGKKRYAYPTMIEAINSFCCKKHRYAIHLKRRLDDAKKARDKAASIVTQEDMDKLFNNGLHYSSSYQLFE